MKRLRLAFILSGLALISSIFAQGIKLIAFVFPFLIGLRSAIKGRQILGTKEANILTVLYILLFFPFFLLYDPFVIALFFLLGLMILKLFTSSQERDADYLALLSFLVFSLSTVFIYTFLFLPLFLIFMFFLYLYLFVRATGITDRKALRFISITALPTFLVGGLLFFILPRNPYMIFGTRYARGIGEFQELEVGGFDREEFSSSVVMRVKPLEGQKGKAVYIRVRIYGEYIDGKWIPLNPSYQLSASSFIKLANIPGESQRYFIQLARYLTFIPLIDYPAGISFKKPVRVGVCRGCGMVSARGKYPMEYIVYSRYRPGFYYLLMDHGFYQRVPDSLKLYLTEFINSLDFKGVSDTLGYLEQFLKNHYRYGRFYPRSDTLPKIIDFLFNAKQGECTEFATAFVLLARMLGYRARLVGGFLTDEFNPIGGYFIVRERNAHAWAEVYYAGRWWRYDPTPFDRKESFWNRISAYLDYIQYKWFTQIVEFSYENQLKVMIKFAVLRYLIFKKFKANFSKIVSWTLIFLILGFIFFKILIKIFKSPDIIQEFFEVAAREGYFIEEGETLREFAFRIGKADYLRFVESYYAYRFGGCKRCLNECKRILKSL